MTNRDDEHRPRDPALDDTVADEVLEPEGEHAPPHEPAAHHAGDEPDAAIPLEPHHAPPPPPLPPRFREDDELAHDALAESHPDDVHADDPHAGANGSARTPRYAPARVPHQRESQRRWSEDLGDTPSLLDSRAGGAMSADDLERVEVDEIFDRPDKQSFGAVAQYDPEAGRTNVAIKIQAVRQVVRSATSTPFGRLMLAVPVGLAGITLTIIAVTFQTMWAIIAAAIVVPLGAWLLYARYQAWLGHKRYMYRLLETLGEDVSDFDPTRTYRRVGRVVKHRR